MNITYEALRARNKTVADLYDQHAVFTNKITDRLSDASLTRGARQAEAIAMYEKGIEVGESLICHIEDTAISALSKLTEQFNSETMSLLEATNLVNELKKSGNYRQAMTNPTMRSAVSMYGSVFGDGGLTDILIVRDDVFRETYSEQLKPINEVLDAVEDLRVSYAQQLQKCFDDFQEAEAIARSRYIPEE